MSASAPATSTPRPIATTVGELTASGYLPRTVKQEIRDNLVAALQNPDVETAFPGIVGFDDTVLPELERTLLAGHDFVLLGERGQGKTRLMRTLVGLLDEWSPVIAGCEINDEPTAPVCARCLRLADELGDGLPILWRHRSDRYGEKLATPDTSVGDLVGDVDPIKVAEGRTLGDPETVHYGLVPRTNRGVFALNELPDLAERIQVALFNVLEERDIQIRGYSLRLPLDLLLVASANPEDYTNRGRIITPLKDRFGAEIRTHYPLEVDDEVELIEQEAQLSATLPHHLVQVIARFARALRESTAIDQRAGVSARFAVAATESMAAGACAAAPGRTAPSRWPASATSPVSSPPCSARSSSRWARKAASARCWTTFCGWRPPRRSGHCCPGSTCPASPTGSPRARPSRPVSLSPPRSCSTSSARFPAWPRCWTGSVKADAPSPGTAAAAVEFVLEGLYLTRRISKESVDDLIVYGS